ncbi:hypothetical protein AB6A40_008864 [Gnathostoma spinigerum]|uniref:Uncharacterized protein n=1 Tax=Gnathostoma spinigerum TaxID=75299 RepID=A0ABD6F0G5_9BILA
MLSPSISTVVGNSIQAVSSINPHSPSLSNPTKNSTPQIPPTRRISRVSIEASPTTSERRLTQSSGSSVLDKTQDEPTTSFMSSPEDDSKSVALNQPRISLVGRHRKSIFSVSRLKRSTLPTVSSTNSLQFTSTNADHYDDSAVRRTFSGPGLCDETIRARETDDIGARHSHFYFFCFPRRFRTVFSLLFVNFRCPHTSPTLPLISYSFLIFSSSLLQNSKHRKQCVVIGVGTIL